MSLIESIEKKCLGIAGWRGTEIDYSVNSIHNRTRKIPDDLTNLVTVHRQLFIDVDNTLCSVYVFHVHVIMNVFKPITIQ